jgi:hypothetical protein
LLRSASRSSFKSAQARSDEKSGTGFPVPPLIQTLTESARGRLLVLGVELGFAVVAAEGHGFAVFAFAGDAGVSGLATDGAFVSRSRQTGGCEGEGNDGEQSFHRLSMFGMFEARRDCRAVGKTYETPRLLSILIFSLPFRPPTP